MSSDSVVTLSDIQPQPVARAQAETNLDAETSRRSQVERRARWILWLAHAAVVLVTTLRHEVWRDEAQAWLIATASGGPAELFSYLRYEGHPALWYLCLWVLSRLSDHLLLMQLFHVAIATATAAILIFASPLRLWHKALLVFGYFFVYEYAAISRGYGLGVLLAFASVALIARRNRPMVWIGVLLFLLANTSVYGAILAAGIGAGLGVDWFVARQGIKPCPAGWRLGLAALLCAGGLALCYVQVTRYPANEPRFISSFEPIGNKGEALGKFLPLARAMLPLHVPGEPPWGTHYLINYRPYPVRFWFALCGAAFVGAMAILLVPKPAVWATAAVGGGAMLGFTAFVFEGFARHHGHYFVLFVILLWLWQVYDTPSRPQWLNRMAAAMGRARRAGGVLLGLLLCVHALAGFQVVLWDLRHPFSRAEEAADYVLQNYPEGTLIMGFRDTPASCVAAHLRRPVLYLEAQSFGGPVDWKARNARPKGVSLQPMDLLREALAHHSAGGEGLLLSQVSLESNGNVILIEVARTGPGREEFIIYWAQRRAE